VREYHVDGFRIDDFRSIDNWNFVQAFRDRATLAAAAAFPGRPFLVVAEDSARRAFAARDDGRNPGQRRVVDAIWNFAYRDEARHLLADEIVTAWGQASRRDRIEALVSGTRMWEPLAGQFREGFTAPTQAVNYLTSHDVGDENGRRFANDVYGRLLRGRGLGDGSITQVRALVDGFGGAPEAVLETVRSGFALLLTSAGIPMFLAGEEFADVHDLDAGDWRLKMSDPVEWHRQEYPGHRLLRRAVRDLVQLRTQHPALRIADTDFFYWHPDIDQNAGARVFAYCRTGGTQTGSASQVIVVANAGPADYSAYTLPWPWANQVPARERGPMPGWDPVHIDAVSSMASLALCPFRARVFET
jgi:1,4-alpha-glucan branching enzyme